MATKAAGKQHMETVVKNESFFVLGLSLLKCSAVVSNDD